VSLVVVDFTVVLSDPDVRDSIVAQSVPLQMKTRIDEPGCLEYIFSGDPARPDTIHAFELWESEEALDAHLQHENYWAMRKLIEGVGITAFTDRKHKIAQTGRVYGPGMTPSAYFD